MLFNYSRQKSKNIKITDFLKARRQTSWEV